MERKELQNRLVETLKRWQKIEEEAQKLKARSDRRPSNG